jgi:hypothetical protein
LGFWNRYQYSKQYQTKKGNRMTQKSRLASLMSPLQNNNQKMIVTIIPQWIAMQMEIKARHKHQNRLQLLKNQQMKFWPINLTNFNVELESLLIPMFINSCQN